MKVFNFVLGGVAMIVAADAASAKDIIVHMKNSGPGGIMVFVPMQIVASPGDVVHFLPTDAGHNAQTIEGMLPVGVSPSAGKINQKFDLRVTKTGLYGIECKPHFGLGMVAVVKVGKGLSPNATAARAVKLPPLAQRRMKPMLDILK